MNFIFRFIAITVMVAPVSALANTWSCTHNNLIRTVSIEYSDPDTAPCAVNYTKETEGVEMQTLWKAENDTTYCTEKAEGLVAKLESWGWACSTDETAEPESKPAVEAAPVSEPEAEPATP